MLSAAAAHGGVSVPSTVPGPERQSLVLFGPWIVEVVVLTGARLGGGHTEMEVLGVVASWVCVHLFWKSM